MKRFASVLMMIGLGSMAQAYQPTPGCDFRFHGGNRNIPNVDGYKVAAVQAEYQLLHIYGQSQAQYRTERRPAWDGGPMEYVKTEVKPAQSSRVQRKLIRPGYFLIKDAEGRQIGRFDKATDVQNYVCQIIIPTYSKRKPD